MKTATYPERWKNLPLDPVRGTPVPWFVHFDPEGVPRYDIIGEGKFAEAIRFRRCWICGGRLGKYLTFVVGPMCVINRISAEPPSHLECGLAAARLCPFMTHPKMRRPERELPAGCVISPEHNPRNPGICCVYVTFGFKVIPTEVSYVVAMDDFNDLSWFTEGRPAERAEIDRALAEGFLLLKPEVEAKHGAAGLDGFRRQFETLLKRIG